MQWCNVFLVLSADIQTPIDVKRAALVKLKQKKFLWNSTWNQNGMAHERQLQAGCSKVNFNNIDQAKSNNIFLNCMYGEGKSECLKSKSLLVCPQMPLDCYQIVWASSADEARLCPEIVSHPRRLSAGEEQLLIIMELIFRPPQQDSKWDQDENIFQESLWFPQHKLQ